MRKGMLATLTALAWPTMIEQFMQTAVQYVDTVMVGSLGTLATAAVGCTSTVNWLVGSSISALGVGFLSYISQAYGAGEKEKAANAVTQAFLTAGVVGLLFTAITLGLSGMVPVWMQADPLIRDVASRYFFILYLPILLRTASIIFGTVLRAAGDTRTPMRVGIWVNIINVVMNFLLIYPSRQIQVFGLTLPMWGADMGVLGAAVASALSLAFGGIAITARLWRHPVLSPRGRSFKPNRSILQPCLKVALPNMLQRFGTSLGYVAFASMINSLGEVSTAAHTIANTVESAFYIPGYGLQTAAATLAGNAKGARNRKAMRELAGVVIPVEIGLMILSGGLLFVFAPMLVNLFTKDPAVVSLGSTVLRMVAVSEPFYGVFVIIEGMMQGVGETVIPFVFNIIGMWCVRIAGTFICIQLLGMGLVSAWACMIGHNLLLCILYLLLFTNKKRSPLYTIPEANT